MRVDKTILFNTMIFTCHLSLSLRSVNRIDSISSTVQNTNWKKKKNSPIQRRRQWQISQPHNTLTHMHAHTITKQGFGDWEFGGVYVRRIWTVNLGANSVWGKDRCVLSHQDSKFRGKCFWKAPHSYSNRLTATNNPNKSTIKHWQWRVANWPMATIDLCIMRYMQRMGGYEVL